MPQNALRAVVEFHRESTELPKIKILICKGREDVIIKVCTVVVSLLLKYIMLGCGLTCIVSCCDVSICNLLLSNSRMEIGCFMFWCIWCVWCTRCTNVCFRYLIRVAAFHAVKFIIFLTTCILQHRDRHLQMYSTTHRWQVSGRSPTVHTLLLSAHHNF